MLHTILLAAPHAAAHSYEIVAPLNREGRLDAQAWRRRPEACTVLRRCLGESARAGSLHLGADAAGRTIWFIRFDDGAWDEPCYRIGARHFRRGEQVGVRDPRSAVMQTFEVREVRHSRG